MRIMYSCCGARSEPVPAASLCVGVCVCIRVPEHPSAPLHAGCLLNVTHAASPFKPASSPNPAPCILKNSLTSVRQPSFNVISSECSVPACRVCSFKSDFSEPSSNQIELKVDNGGDFGHFQFRRADNF